MKCLIACLSFILAILSPDVVASDDLQEKFRSPPPETRPWCYWYWINDNISREGITKDLEAMARVGIGAALIGNQSFPDQPAGTVPILSEEWWNLTVHAVQEARRLGIDIGLFNCPGWSQSGGPWVQLDQSMRYLASSERRVRGPARFSEIIPPPGDHFQDIATIAIPAPAGEEESLSENSASVTASSEIENVGSLLDGDLSTATDLFASNTHRTQQIEIVAKSPFTARSMTLTPGDGAFWMEVDVQAQVNGQYQSIRKVKYDRRNPHVKVGPMPKGPVVASLPETESDRFRLVCSLRQGTGKLAEIEISSAARVELFVEKQLGKMHPTPTPLWGDYLWAESPEPLNDALIVDPRRVVDISEKLDVSGKVNWNIPEGEWIIQRIGMLPTGIQNAPASPHATGPEVDKMNRQHLAAHFDAFVGELIRRLPAEDKSALKYVVADSYEMGPQNWTDRMRRPFTEVYGYDPVAFLPVLSGRIVGSAEKSDRFLWDLRRLVADLVAEDYVGGLRDLCNDNGLQMWLENYGHWGFPGDFMRYGGQCDLISGEFWVTGTLGNIECRAAASTAHVYDKPIVYAEAFTSGDNWVYTPLDLKRRGDWAFTEGINHFVLHLYIQQPSDDFVPGMNAWFGTEFNRHNTWFEEGKDWIDYLRRCHLLLQQGIHVGDFAYFIGEDTPIMTGTRNPIQPEGYDFDYINAEVILERLTVEDGRWTLPNGKSYAILVLPPLETMRPAVLSRLLDLVAQGGILFGKAPRRSPSLQDSDSADAQVETLAQEMWQGLAEDAVGHVSVGKGQIFQGGQLDRVVRELNLPGDISDIDASKVLWTHRQSSDMDIYFLSNQTMAMLELQPVFRDGNGRIPELWHADTGRIEKLAHFTHSPDGTTVPLTLDPAGSLFVVFRQNAKVPGHVTRVQGPGKAQVREVNGQVVATFDKGGQYDLESPTRNAWQVVVQEPPKPMPMKGLWHLSFRPIRDNPGPRTLIRTRLWTNLQSEAIRHYSGTGVYRTTFQIPTELLDDETLVFQLDLGRVEPMARVRLNGEDLGLLWKPPYHLDVTDYLKDDENRLEIAVTNLWSNRLLGEMKFPDGIPGLEGEENFKPRNSVQGKLNTKRPLQPSGLEGPVRIVPLRRLTLSE